MESEKTKSSLSTEYLYVQGVAGLEKRSSQKNNEKKTQTTTKKKQKRKKKKKQIQKKMSVERGKTQEIVIFNKGAQRDRENL